MGGKVIRIPEDVKEKVRSMRREGINAQEISKHSKELGRTISLGAIYSICKGIKKGKRGGGAEPPGNNKRARPRGRPPADC